MHISRRRHEKLRVAAILTNHSQLRTVGTIDWLFGSARVTKPTTLNTLHDNIVPNGYVVYCRTNFDNRATDLVAGNNWILCNSLFVITESAVADFQIRHTNSDVGHLNCNVKGADLWEGNFIQSCTMC